jgi:pyruvate dehydrogenase E2 component (dihydrolipoamide acetyltransferase)
LATPVTMPQLGETVVEGTITKWLKQEWQTVEGDEAIFEISTD